MYFQALQLRLIATVKERVRNGELTERSLARMTGISQPHMHNVLKGARILSPEIADQILRHLRISVLDLLDGDELNSCRHHLETARFTEIPILEGRVGPRYPPPAVESPIERYPFLASQLAQLDNPVAARAAADAQMLGLIQDGDLVLLDRSVRKRTHPNIDGLYLILHPTHSAIRRARRIGDRLMLISEDCLAEPRGWVGIPLAGRHILDIVAAKVIWIGREMEHRVLESGPAEETGTTH